MAEVFVANVADSRSIRQLRKAVNLARSLPFSVNIWWTQNLCHERVTRADNEFLSKAKDGAKDAQAWISQLTELSEELCFSVSIADSAQCPNYGGRPGVPCVRDFRQSGCLHPTRVRSSKASGARFTSYSLPKVPQVVRDHAQPQPHLVRAKAMTAQPRHTKP